jgi:hypothetical protein
MGEQHREFGNPAATGLEEYVIAWPESGSRRTRAVAIRTNAGWKFTAKKIRGL